MKGFIRAIFTRSATLLISIYPSVAVIVSQWMCHSSTEWTGSALPKLFACPLIKISTGIAKKQERVHPDFPYLCPLLISIFDPKDNVGFVLTWGLRDGIGELSPRMNTQEDKAGSCCGLRRMWRYHLPLPLLPSAACCVHHVLPPLSKCTSQLGAFCSICTFLASCMYKLLSSSAKRQKKYTFGVCDHIRLCDCETAWMNVLPTPWLSIWTSAEFTECRS